MSEIDGDELEDETANSIDLLLAGDTHGNLHLSVYGVYNLQPISLSQHVGAKVAESNFSSEFNCGFNNGRTSSAVKVPPKDRLLVITLDTGLLYTRKFEIQILSQRYTAIKHLTDYIYNGVKLVEAEYQTIKLTSNKFIDIFQEVMDLIILVGREKVKTTLSAEYARLLATGRPSKILAEYMEGRITKRGLKDWESKGRKAFEQIRDYVHHYIRAGCERLLLELNALVGYSKWPQKFQELGLVESFVHPCVIITGCLISRLEKLLNVIDNEYINFLEFQQWIQFEFDSLALLDQNGIPEVPPRVDIHKVAAYLKNSLKKESSSDLEEFFGTSETLPILTLPTFEFPFSFSTQHRQFNEKMPAYPYDYHVINSISHYPQTLWTFVNVLTTRCNTLSSSTADNVARSVIANGYLELIDELVDSFVELGQGDEKVKSKSVLLTDMRIVVENSETVEYITFHASSTTKRDLSEACMQMKPASCDKTHEKSFRKSSGRKPAEIAGIQLINKEYPEACLLIRDLKFFDNERLHIIVAESDEKGDEIYHLTELNYTSLNFLPINEPRGVENMDTLGVVNVVDQVFDKMNLKKIKPSQLTVNGARDLVCVLNGDRKRILMFDTNDKEETDDEKEEDVYGSSEMMEE
ncbi:12744_t:CDS:10 [Acaulospora colombiana]|uniref:12744_t:CDS:1 n=1 Tax=Acaulospora colombiana TaxID=27376 RepID=A0ACA9LHT7_9GLOM|nr:12744_t:CDS:10 [Acaulospora colombiana]